LSARLQKKSRAWDEWKPCLHGFKKKEIGYICHRQSSELFSVLPASETNFNDFCSDIVKFKNVEGRLIYK